MRKICQFDMNLDSLVNLFNSCTPEMPENVWLCLC